MGATSRLGREGGVEASSPSAAGTDEAAHRRDAMARRVLQTVDGRAVATVGAARWRAEREAMLASRRSDDSGDAIHAIREGEGEGGAGRHRQTNARCRPTGDIFALISLYHL